MFFPAADLCALILNIMHWSWHHRTPDLLRYKSSNVPPILRLRSHHGSAGFSAPTWDYGFTSPIRTLGQEAVFPTCCFVLGVPSFDSSVKRERLVEFGVWAGKTQKNSVLQASDSCTRCFSAGGLTSLRLKQSWCTMNLWTAGFAEKRKRMLAHAQVKRRVPH